MSREMVNARLSFGKMIRRGSKLKNLKKKLTKKKREYEASMKVAEKKKK